MNKTTFVAIATITLTGAGLASAQISKEATLVKRSNWSELGTVVQKADYSGALLNSRNMSLSTTPTTLNYVSFNKASLRYSTFDSAVIQNNVTFDDADLSFAVFSSGANLTSTSFKNTILDGATLSGVITSSAKFATTADFSGARFSKTTNIEAMSFENVALSKTRFEGTDLSKVTNLEKATYTIAPEFTKETLLPVGFDAKAAGWVEVTSVPEPSSSALLGLGGLALILRRRK